MLITMLTAMYVMVKVVESIGVRFAREEDTVPYMVSQPLPWQVHSVSHSRKSSKAEEVSAHNVHIPPVPVWSLISIDALESDYITLNTHFYKRQKNLIFKYKIFPRML
uniref:Uncharacterized protein n=1 Tax=Takifugu rubripes TaxID=31033 RepID=A0A3B5K510_TAKRU